MIKVFQALRKVEVYEKPRYTPEVRVAFWTWDQPKFTSGIAIQNEVLIVPGYADQNIKHSNFLTFLESVSPDNSEQILAELPVAYVGFENLRFKSEEERVGVFTSFSQYRYSEVPIAENHQIAELKPGDTLRFMANDRYDFSMAARKQRRYVLYDYLVHYKGLARKIEYTGNQVRKTFQPGSWKEVDERKIIK